MKTKFSTLLLLAFLPLALIAQEKESQYIQWTGEDEVANALVGMGIDHAMNIEFEKAYTFFDAAVAKDPSLFAPHVMLASLSKGEKREMHMEKAKELVEGKNEVSKMFVSLLEYGGKGEDLAAKRRATWAKMHELAHDGRFVHFRYALSLEDPKAQIAELEALAAKNMKDEKATGHIHNILGYAYYAEGDKGKAKEHLDKYLELRPNGYNAQDSMAEFYLNEGDMENAMVYYKKAVANYPGAANAKEKIAEIKKKMEMASTDQKK